MPRYALVLAFLVACSTSSSPPAVDATVADDPVVDVPATAPSCTAVLKGPSLAGGGPLCMMSVTITIACPHGQGGRAEAIYGEASAPALYAARADVGYQCGVPIELSRWGFACTDGVVAEAGWWNPDGTGPYFCTVTQI